MSDFLSANLGTIIVLLILIVAVFFIVRGMLKDRKKGKSSCGCDCGHCAMSGTCHGK